MAEASVLICKKTKRKGCSSPHGRHCPKNAMKYERILRKTMKTLTRITAMLAAILMLAALLSGCATKDQNPSASAAEAEQTPVTETAPTSEPAAEEPEQPQETGSEQAESTATAAEGAHITPIPSGFDPINLEDCMFHVSFTNDDIELNDEGTFVLHMTVWEQELFDMVDVAMLKAGDTITIRGEDITVASVEREDSIVHINGGAENGGITLAASEEGGTFYESNAEVTEYDAVYTAVAQLTLPVDADNFFYTDKSDLEGDTTYYPGDLLTRKDTVDFSCTALNGIAHIVDHQVAEITRTYMP